MSTDKRLLRLAGTLAEAARAVTGGYNLFGEFVAPATLHDAAQKLADLKGALDEYDRAILAAAEVEEP